MPRDPQVPQFFRTLRVKNVNQIGVLASVLSVIAKHGGSVGDIRTVQQSRTFMVRDIDIIMETLEEFDALVVDFDSHEETTVVELRDEVLTAHLGGKIRVVSRAPIDTFADLGRVYTPGVGEVCRRISEDARLADNYTIIPNTCAIVSDGSAVLGLGNLGATASMPVLEGKAALMAHLAGVNAIPIALKSQEPDDIVEAVAAISATFGVIQLEDIASPKCFDVEPALQEKVDVAVFHDDQHGTAAVVLATLINACRLTGLSLGGLRVGQIGLGAAGLAIARSVMHYTGNPVMGADRVQGPMDRLASWGGTPATIEEICARCDVVIATTGRPGLIEPAMVRPGQFIFALSNPRPEIDAAEALEAGARIAESG
ncbi:MAG TPA: NAD-dependent malic enzyme, partial [Dehalococcoidia bacterium]|nr:NAD-dependent malic enzyme [Dehalococcoidia bacterium]